jgi:hypothetical protein
MNSNHNIILTIAFISLINLSGCADCPGFSKKKVRENELKYFELIAEFESTVLFKYTVGDSSSPTITKQLAELGLNGIWREFSEDNHLSDSTFSLAHFGHSMGCSADKYLVYDIRKRTGLKKTYSSPKAERIHLFENWYYEYHLP